MNALSQYMERPLRVVVGIAVVCTMVVAVAAHPAAAHPSARPHVGGTISVRLTAVPDCLDPQVSPADATGALTENIVDPLLSADEHGRLRPDIALRWRVGNGGKVVTFSLRHGVRFSNGDPLDATAVKFTLDRALNPKTKSYAAGELTAVKAVQVVNRYTVRLVLKTPYRPILGSLSSRETGILDPKTLPAGADFCKSGPIGSGPFKIQSVAPGFSTITLVRNPFHNWATPWGHNKGAAYLSTIVYKPIVSDATAVSELLTKELDMSSVAGDQVLRVKGNSAVRLHKNPVVGEAYLGFNTRRPPFDKAAVRRAMGEAIDRTAIIKAALNGLGVPAYSAIPGNMLFYDKGAKSYGPQYNPTDARRVLAANHVTGPFTLVTDVPGGDATAAELIQAELANVGVKINVETKPEADYISLLEQGQFDLNILSWNASDPQVMYLLFHSSQIGSGYNFTGYRSAALDQAIIAGQVNLSSKKAKAAYATVQRLINQIALIVPLWTPITLTGTTARVGGWHTDAFGVPLLQDFYVRP